MKKGQIYYGTIEDVDFPNKAVISYQEKMPDGEMKSYKIHVKGGIPGQKVSFLVQKIRRDDCKGRIMEVLEKSPLETEEMVCPVFGQCGGCSYQTIPYNKQLLLKKQQVLKLIDGTLQEFYHENMADVKKRYVYDGILPSPDIFEYRNKMEFSFGDEMKDGPLTLGLHKKGSFHDILDADCCQIVHEDFRKILVCVREFCKEKGIPFYKKKTHQGILRHLLVRRSSSSGEILAGLVVSSQRLSIWAERENADIWSELTERLAALSAKNEDNTPDRQDGSVQQGVYLEGKLAGFLLILNDSLGDVVQSDHMDILFGRDYIMEEILGLRFKITPFSFFQTNSKGAEVLYQRAREYIVGSFEEMALENHVLKNQVVFDLYSGTGTIAQIIAPIAKKVIGVEIIKEAVEAARENAALNGLSNCEFITGDVLKVLDEIKDRPDFIILDPPREGIHPKALKKIIAYAVEKIVYISCQPASLSRDLALFLENGYELKQVSNVDMFGGTVHVETVLKLVRK